MLNMILIIGWLLNIVVFIPFLIFTFKQNFRGNQKMRIILAIIIPFGFFSLFVSSTLKFIDF